MFLLEKKSKEKKRKIWYKNYVPVRKKKIYKTEKLRTLHLKSCEIKIHFIILKYYIYLELPCL